MGAAVPDPPLIFISYAHEDEPFLRELLTHLSPLQREGKIRLWHDRTITPGAAWDPAIEEQLRAAGIILLLVSADYIASDYCNREAQEALARKDATVIPIVVRPADWTSQPYAQLQALPKDARPVIEWSNRDEPWAQVARAIRYVLEQPGLPFSALFDVPDPKPSPSQQVTALIRQYARTWSDLLFLGPHRFCLRRRAQPDYYFSPPLFFLMSVLLGLLLPSSFCFSSAPDCSAPSLPQAGREDMAALFRPLQLAAVFASVMLGLGVAYGKAAAWFVRRRGSAQSLFHALCYGSAYCILAYDVSIPLNAAGQTQISHVLLLLSVTPSLVLMAGFNDITVRRFLAGLALNTVVSVPLLWLLLWVFSGSPQPA